MLAWISLAIILLTSGAALCAVVIYLMARMLLSPPRLTDGRAMVLLRRLTPMDLNLEYENVKFQVRDESTGNTIAIAAWWIPSATPQLRTVIILHGYGDAKVGGIAWAPMFHEMGWNVLAVDLRAHGQSEGVYSTAGFWERHDLVQVINRLHSDRPRETQTLVLFGVSLGAAVALAASIGREDISALILEGPFANYRDAIAAHGAMQGAPGGWIQELAIRLAESIAKADFDVVRPVDLIPQPRCPIMLIHAANDYFMISDESQKLADALAKHSDERDVFWEVPSAGHVLCLACEPEEYRKRIDAFLDACVGKSPRSMRAGAESRAL